MIQLWPGDTAGVLALPSGRLIRGRALRRELPDGLLPEFGVYLLGRRPPPTPWEQRWVRWRDFGLPAEREDAADALLQAWRRAQSERVEVACAGGRGRTGTALACLAILDGVAAQDAVAFVHAHYDPRAVETPAQRRYVERFAPAVE